MMFNSQVKVVTLLANIVISSKKDFICVENLKWWSKIMEIMTNDLFVKIVN